LWFCKCKWGTIFIGVNNNGKIIGLKNTKRLLEEIPNKVRDILGIMVDVNLHKTDEGNYIEIAVEPYPTSDFFRKRGIQSKIIFEDNLSEDNLHLLNNLKPLNYYSQNT